MAGTSTGNAGDHCTPAQQHVEIWAAASSLRARLLLCGHVVNGTELESQGSSVLCPICGQSPALSGLPLGVPDYVPTSALSWDHACTKDTSLVHLKEVSGTRTFEQLLVMLAVEALRIDLHGAKLQPQLPPRAEDSFLVWRAAPAGCTVQNGTIALPKGGIVLLTGHGLHFSKTTFSGGVIMCAGPHFSGTFTECTFDQCTLYAVHGADSRLCGCRFTRCTPAVVASGAATIARLTGCLFHSCHTGLVAECGAAALMQDSAIADCVIGLIANGPGSHVDMEDSTAEVRGAAVTLLCGVAVVVSKGRARLVRCNLNGQQFAVHAIGRGTAAEVLESSIASHMRSVIADLSARATVWDVDACTDSRLDMRHRYPGFCSRSMMDHGAITMQVSDGAVLQALRCRVRGYGSGVVTSTGGRADVLLCALRCAGVAAAASSSGSRGCLRSSSAVSTAAECLWQSEGGVLRAEGCHITRDDGVCINGKAGAVIVSDSVIAGGSQNPHMEAVSVVSCTASMLRCRVLSRSVGLWSDDSDVRLVDSEIVSTRDHSAQRSAGKASRSIGLSFCGRTTGSMAVKGGSVRGFSTGLSCGENGSRTEFPLRVESVRFVECARAVQCQDMVVAEICDCQFILGDAVVVCAEDAAGGGGVAGDEEGADREPHCPTAIRFLDADSGLVRGCVFEGAWSAVVVDSFKPVHVQDCVARFGAGAPAPFVRVLTRAVVEGCAVAGASLGVLTCSHGSAVIRRCSFGPACMRGVSVQLGGSAEALDCKFNGAEAGMLCVGGSGIARGCSFGAGCKHGVSLLSGGSAQVIDCTFRGTESAMEVSEGGGSLSVQDCVCVDVCNGVFVTGDNSVVSAKRLSVRGAQIGVRAACPAGKTVIKLVDCKFEGPRGGDPRLGDWCGVVVASAGTRLSVLRCEMEGLLSGIFVQGSCSIRVRSSNVRRCRQGLTIGPPQLELNAPGCPVCNRCGVSGYKHAVRAVLAAQGAPMLGAQCPHEGAVARAVVEDVIVEECPEMGMQVSIGGHVTATRLRVVGCPLSVVWAAEQSCFEECVVTDRKQVTFIQEHVSRPRQIVRFQDVHGLHVE